MTTFAHFSQQLLQEEYHPESMGLTYQQIFDFSPDPILITDQNADIIYVNTAWEALSGYSFAEVCGKNPKLLQSGKTPSPVYKKMWQALKQGKSFITEELIDKSKSGKEYQLHSTVFPIIKNGEIRYYVQMQHDITSRKFTETIKSEFLSIAAHELKTPLTTLSLSAELLLRTQMKKGENSSHFAMLDKQIKRFTKLINELLDISRIDTGKLFLHKQDTDIVSLTQESVRRIAALADSYNITITIPDIPMIIYADPNRIEEVLTNLLTNAIKYSPSQTTIEVNVKQKKNRVLITVTDQGIGIPKNKLSHIFERFYQIRTGKTEGFGLGLYIAKGIITKHHGRLWAISKIGKGSTFVISLPLKQIE